MRENSASIAPAARMTRRWIDTQTALRSVPSLKPETCEAFYRSKRSELVPALSVTDSFFRFRAAQWPRRLRPPPPGSW